jgi:hypothetical protein
VGRESGRGRIESKEEVLDWENKTTDKHRYMLVRVGSSDGSLPSMISLL